MCVAGQYQPDRGATNCTFLDPCARGQVTTLGQSGQVGGIYYKDDLIAAPMRLVDGAVELPDGVGMGIAADEAKIRRYSVARG